MNFFLPGGPTGHPCPRLRATLCTVLDPAASRGSLLGIERYESDRVWVYNTFGAFPMFHRVFPCPAMSFNGRSPTETLHGSMCYPWKGLGLERGWEPGGR